MANTNYARLQYDGLSVTEKERLKNSLLHYCELDTMAMVLIYEFFKIHSVNPPGGFTPFLSLSITQRVVLALRFTLTRHS